MARVTATEVKQIISTNLSDSEVAPFITLANQLVTLKLSTKTALSSDNLKEIERWISAHYICLYEKREAGRGIVGFGNIGGTYGKDPFVGFGLGATFYGQSAIELDVTGTLTELGKTRASITIIKSPEV